MEIVNIVQNINAPEEIEANLEVVEKPARRQRPPARTAEYHKAAIRYNEILAEAAEAAASELEDPRVRGWAERWAGHYRSHQKHHIGALGRIEKQDNAEKVEAQA